MAKEILCDRDEKLYSYKYVVEGTFVGDKDELIDKERILQVARMTDSNEAWEMLWNADFDVEECNDTNI